MSAAERSRPAGPGGVGALRRHADELTTTSEQLAAQGWEADRDAQRAATQAQGVSDAAEQTAGNVGSIAVAVEQMGASITEISRNTTQAAAIAEAAERDAQAAAGHIERLGRVSQRAGGVVKAISTVARRTHLLALNAAIESARAGEAGRAFQVVAHEVRSLAHQTSTAADEVTRTLEEVRADGTGAIEAISQIRATIHDIALISRTIAEAVAQQLRTADEISRNLSEAANGVVRISEDSAAVAEGVQKMRTHAQSTQSVASDLLRLSTTLGRIAGRLESADPAVPGTASALEEAA
jgi:methyl-accepting chemotaxis protein